MGFVLDIPGWGVLLVAPVIGSFIGVVIRRLPRGESFLWSRSACPSCGHRLSARELVPLLSFVVQAGRCRACGARIGWFHLLVEVAALAVAGLAVAVEPDAGAVWLTSALGWWLLTLAWIDAEEMILPDGLTLPLLLAGLGWTWWAMPDALLDHAIGCVAGFGLLTATAWGFRRWRGQDALGGGDARLFAAFGAWLDWDRLPWVLMTASLLGLAAFGWISARRGALDRNLRLPFGPALAAGFVVQWLMR